MLTDGRISKERQCWLGLGGQTDFFICFLPEPFHWSCWVSHGAALKGYDAVSPYVFNPVRSTVGENAVLWWKLSKGEVLRGWCLAGTLDVQQCDRETDFSFTFCWANTESPPTLPLSRSIKGGISLHTALLRHRADTARSTVHLPVALFGFRQSPHCYFPSRL